MAFANRAVILFKIKHFEWAIKDLNLAIISEKYPNENLHKLYQRLAKSHEHLQEFQSAIDCYNMFVKSLKFSKLTKSEKLQIKSGTEKAIAFCKKGLMASNLTSFIANEENDTATNFPNYKTPHLLIPNASGKCTIYGI